MIRPIVLSLLVTLLASSAQAGLFAFCSCPTDDRYSAECLKSSIPPWPICLFHDAEYFVEKAEDGATRCCGGDITDCRCPKKDTEKFQEAIGEWCDGVKTCTDSRQHLITAY
jgi:hypothetical protein